ncbi:hypothetical protein BH09ACT12_BH09ACT12_10670 [soil metagenome]
MFEDAVFNDAGTAAQHHGSGEHDSQGDDDTAGGTGGAGSTSGWAGRLPRLRLSAPSTFAGPLPPRVGAPIAGLVTGIGLLCLMWLGFRGCEALSGTESCGAGPGMVALVVVFALTVVVGQLTLSLLKVPDAGMTSFLAVGITSLIAVLLLGGLFDSALILVVLPVLSALAFAGSWWISTVQLDGNDD